MTTCVLSIFSCPVYLNKEFENDDSLFDFDWSGAQERLEIAIMNDDMNSPTIVLAKLFNFPIVKVSFLNYSILMLTRFKFLFDD